MDLLDFPPEIFQRIIHEFVSDVGIQKAWKCRQVCRTFSVEIHHNIFTKQTIGMVSEATHVGEPNKIIQSNLAIYLANRSKVPLDAHQYLPKKINDMVDFLVKNRGPDTDSRRQEHTKYICEAIATQVNSQILLRLLRYGITSVTISWSTRQAEDKAAVAAMLGDISLFKSLLPDLHGNNLHVSGIFGAPLAIAVKGESSAIITAVLEYLHDTSSKRKLENSCILYGLGTAVEKKDMALIKRLVDWNYAHVGKVGKGHYSGWLSCAIKTGDVKLLEYLLTLKIKSGPRVTIANFQLACECGNPEVVKLLIGNGRVDPEERHGTFSPLTMAVRKGNADVVEAVLDAGAHINGIKASHASHNPHNPLCLAIIKGHKEVVRLLLERGASTQRDRNRNIIKPLDRAFMKYKHVNKDIHEMVRQAIMRETGQTINTYDDRKKTGKRYAS